MSKPLLSPSLGEIREIYHVIYFFRLKNNTLHRPYVFKLRPRFGKNKKQMNKNYIIILYYIFMLYNYILHQYYRKTIIY